MQWKTVYKIAYSKIRLDCYWQIHNRLKCWQWHYNIYWCHCVLSETHHHLDCTFQRTVKPETYTSTGNYSTADVLIARRFETCCPCGSWVVFGDLLSMRMSVKKTCWKCRWIRFYHWTSQTMELGRSSVKWSRSRTGCAALLVWWMLRLMPTNTENLLLIGGSSCDYCAIDEDGILHISSRLKNADLSDQVKYPKILPRGSHVTKLVIKLPGLVLKPDLPEDRLESAPPFYLLCSWLFWSTHREGKTWGEIKRCVVIFMSMASRAIHLEIANSLDADLFLNTFRRFTIRRRPVRQLQSDQGANFATGWRKLMETLNEMDHKQIKPSPLPLKRTMRLDHL